MAGGNRGEVTYIIDSFNSVRCNMMRSSNLLYKYRIASTFFSSLKECWSTNRDLLPRKVFPLCRFSTGVYPPGPDSARLINIIRLSFFKWAFWALA